MKRLLRLLGWLRTSDAQRAMKPEARAKAAWLKRTGRSNPP
jgi:hypothetical protein